MTGGSPPISTGVPGLDTILGGGLPRGALVFIVGGPGAGKTILASQVVFHAVERGDKALVLTTFSEGHLKLIEHLRPFSFFAEDRIGKDVTVLSLQTVLGQDADAPGTALGRTIRESGARIVLIDGFQGIADLLDDRRAVRRMLAHLSTLLAFVDVTLVITLAGNGRTPKLARELTTADVVLGLDYRVDGLRHVRHVEVIKQRGQAPLPGLHAYMITAQGHTVFPRLEARPLPAPRPRRAERAGFALPELDALLGGGLTAGTTTLLVGAPGVGKTTLGLYWALAAAQPEHRTVFFSFAEQVEELRTKAQAFGLALDAALASGVLTLLRMPATELSPDVVATHLLEALTVPTARLVVDDIAGLVRALGTRAPDYLAALSDQLYAAGMTSLFLYEIDAFTGLQFDLARTPLSLVAHNVIIVQQMLTGRVLHRTLAVLKMRFSDHDRALRELVLDAQGVRVLSPVETAPGVLEDAATPRGGHGAAGEEAPGAGGPVA